MNEQQPPEWEAEYLARIVDRDLYLSRGDASVVCVAIARSIPAFSRAWRRARIASVLCRFSRLGDRWVADRRDRFYSPTYSEAPIAAEALAYLHKHASAGVQDELKVCWENRDLYRREDGLVPVDALYGMLDRGRLADQARAAAKARIADKEDRSRLEESQRAALGR